MIILCAKKRCYNEANEQRFEQLRHLESAAAVTHTSLRYFANQPVTAIPIVTFSNMDQLTECVQAFA